MSLVEQVKGSGLVTNDLFEMQSGGSIKPIIPKNFTDILNMSEVFFKSGMAPQSLDTASKIAVAIQYGMEIGLPPIQAMQNIAVINKRPALWGDALPALMYKHGHKLEETLEGEGKDMVATCTLTRSDTGQKTTRKFTYKDAVQAGLVGKGVWRQYPQRMIAMRARSWAIRDGAPDAMVGLAVAEEVQDYVQEAPRDITPPSPPSVSPPPVIEENKADLVSFESIKEDFDAQLSTANDLKTMGEIMDGCLDENSLSEIEIDELNDLFDSHMEHKGFVNEVAE